MATKPHNNAEKIIIAIALIVCAAVVGYAANVDTYKSADYDIGDTKSERTEEIISLQNNLFSSTEISVGKVNINTASSTQLQRLEGIGPSRANDIIEYREKNGPFSKIEDIMKIEGIGKTTFEKIKDNIEV